MKIPEEPAEGSRRSAGQNPQLGQGVAEPQPHALRGQGIKIDVKIHEGQDVLSQIVKAVKTFTIYIHNPEAVDSFIKSAHATLSAFLAANEVFPLVISGGSIKYLGEEIYKEDADQLSFAYKFYRDGIRKLVFLRGITIEELRQFANIAAMCSQGAVTASVDIVSLLWKESFIHLEYTVIEGLAPILGSTGLDEKTMEAEVNRVAESITSRIKSGAAGIPGLSGPNFTPGARGGMTLESEESSPKGTDFDVGGMAPLGDIVAETELVSPDYKDFAAKELGAGGETLMLSKLLTILTVLVRLGFDEHEKEDISENVLLVIDMLLANEDFKGIALLFDKLDEMMTIRDASPDFRNRVVQFRLKVVEGFGTEARLERIRLILCDAPLKDVGSLVTVLNNVDERTFKLLPGMVAHIPVVENVTAVCKAFHVARPGLDFVAKQLMRSTSTELIIEGLRAAALVEFEGKTETIRVLLDHPSRDVRFEAIKAIATAGSEEGKQVIAKALEDQDKDVLMAALEAVRRCDPQWTARTLVRLVMQDSFKALPADIQTRFYRTAASTNAPEVFSFFGEIMTKKTSLLARWKAHHTRLRVVDALRAEPSILTHKILGAYSSDPRISPEVREYCKKAMDDIRKALVGE